MEDEYFVRAQRTAHSGSAVTFPELSGRNVPAMSVAEPGAGPR